MSLRVIFEFLILAVLTSQTASLASKGPSPAGGPERNPNAAVCIYLRSSELLNCTKGNSSVTCNTTLPTLVTKDDQGGGPTPLGEYLIGKWRINKGIDWYNLYPKKEDSSGYYPYNESTQTGRDRMGLHPGVDSKGCVTVFAPTYNSDPCWQLIRKLLDCGDMSYRNSSYSGFLFVC